MLALVLVLVGATSSDLGSLARTPPHCMVVARRITGGYLPPKMVEDPEATGFTLGVMLSTEVQRYIFLSITHWVVRRQNAFTPRSCEYGRYAL